MLFRSGRLELRVLGIDTVHKLLGFFEGVLGLGFSIFGSGFWVLGIWSWWPSVVKPTVDQKCFQSESSI